MPFFAAFVTSLAIADEGVKKRKVQPNWIGLDLDDRWLASRRPPPYLQCRVPTGLHVAPEGFEVAFSVYE